MPSSSLLITGANGFVGSSIREMIKGTVDKVFCLYVGDKPSDIYPWEHWTEIDFFTEKDRLEQFLSDTSPGLILHLASLVGVGSSIRSPAAFFNVNATGTLNLLEGIRKLNSDPRVIIAGSGAGYGIPQYLPVDEKHPLLPSSPYAASKVAGEMVALAYHYSYGIHLTILRPFTIYGPSQGGSQLIPAVIQQALGNSSTILLGNLWPVRNFCYITDIASAFLRALNSGNRLDGKIYNLGAKESVEVRTVVDLILKYSGRTWDDVQENTELTRGRTEIPKVEISIDAARNDLGWEPQVTLEEGIKLTVESAQRGLRS